MSERVIWLGVGSGMRRARHVARRIAEKTETAYRIKTGRPHVVNVGDYRMRVPHDMWWAFNGGAYYEQGLAFWLRRSLQASDNRVFYDVGANYGFYSLLLAPLAHAVHAFEPVTSTRRILARNVTDNRINNVVVHTEALSDHYGEATMRMFSSSANNSLFDVQVADHVQATGIEMVQLETIDRLVFEHGLDAPGLVKVDVEGGELPVLRGARRLLAEVRPIITLEFYEPHFDRAGYRARDILDELQAANYATFLIRDRPGDVGLHNPDELSDLASDEVPNALCLPQELVASVT